MAGPLRSLGCGLATVHQGVPFDVFVPGYAPGLDGTQNLALTISMLRQLKLDQEYYGRHLPYDYSYTCAAETIWELAQVTLANEPADATAILNRSSARSFCGGYCPPVLQTRVLGCRR